MSTFSKEDIELIRSSPLFDAEWYGQQYADVLAVGIDPAEHYLWLGARLGRNPSPYFDSVGYLNLHRDVAARGMNPLLHYLRSGEKEGREIVSPSGDQNDYDDFVSLLEGKPLRSSPVRVISFYLPQFHPIPENDQWWGSGFTEWTNVRPALPQFVGHYQPHVPIDVGYYDLRDTAVQRKQIELARLYGVAGFCFYFYWFGGKRLLETPVENWLNDKTLDFPFCLCWANENWSRRWDGLDSEILIAQNHSPEDDIAFITEVARYMRDPRYIRISDKPLLVIYRPDLLPSAHETVTRWREWCRKSGIGEIYIAYAQSFEKTDPRTYGIDAAIEFPPNNSSPPNLTASVIPLRDDFGSTVYDWRIFHSRSENYAPQEYKIFRTVCPGWDNTARRKNGGTIFINNTPTLYRKWLENAIRDTLTRFEDPSERLVFVNAWNEWAEGAHLEPDEKSGYAYLQATRDALAAHAASKAPRIVVVAHDAHPHGAQFLSLNIAHSLQTEFGFDIDLISLGGGPLLGRYAEVATLHRLDMKEDSPEVITGAIEDLRDKGASLAIVNTTVSGDIVPYLKRAGFTVVSLIHELPGILASYDLQRPADAIAKAADKVVFAAQAVRTGFETFVGRTVEQAVIRPQGLYHRSPFRSDTARRKARAEICAELGLPADARIILSSGYADHRKGLDLFVDALIDLMARNPKVLGLWIGHHDQQLMQGQRARISAAGLTHRFVFPGLVSDPQRYYAAADVFALCSREDPFPSVVMEALDAETPVVAFEGAGGFTELLERGCGVLVPPFDTTAFAAAISGMLDDPHRARALARAGKDIVESELSFRHYLFDLLELGGQPLPRVSVVVPNYNYAQYLQARLASIADQTLPVFELIVLDDASSDNSVDVIESFLRTCPIPHRLIRNVANSGSVFHQWLRGAEMARGDLVWIAEADDLADPEFLERLVPAFSVPGTVISYSQSRQMAGDGTILCDHYLDYVADIDPEKWTKPYHVEGREEIARALFVKNTIPNVSGVVFRRDALLQALKEHRDEILSYRNAGDWVTYLRVLEKGSIAFCPDALNSHRRHQGSVTVGNFNLRQLQEIVRVQRDALRRFGLGDSESQRAAAYAQKLYEQFGLASPDHPVYDMHPELAKS